MLRNLLFFHWLSSVGLYNFPFAAGMNDHVVALQARQTFDTAFPAAASFAAAATSGEAAAASGEAAAVSGEAAATSGGAGSGSTTSSAPVPTATYPANEARKGFDFAINGPIFPPAVRDIDDSSSSSESLTVDCLNCSLLGNLSISAGRKGLIDTPPDVDQLGNSTFDFKDLWAAVTAEVLNATFEVAVDIKAGNSEMTVPIYSHTISEQFAIFTLSATLGLALKASINSTNDVNFTYGFTFAVPPGSEIIVDFSDASKSESLGFNQTTLTPIPLNASRGDVDIDMELYLQPSIDLAANADAIILKGGLGLILGLDVPKLDAKISQVHNVTSTCEPAVAQGGAAPGNASAVAVVPKDQIYANMTLVSPTIGLTFFETIQENITAVFFIKDDHAQTFNQTPFESPLPTACFYLDSSKKTLLSSPPAVSPKSGAAIPAHGNQSFGKVTMSLAMVLLLMALL